MGRLILLFFCAAFNAEDHSIFLAMQASLVPSCDDFTLTYHTALWLSLKVAFPQPMLPRASKAPFSALPSFLLSAFVTCHLCFPFNRRHIHRTVHVFEMSWSMFSACLGQLMLHFLHPNISKAEVLPLARKRIVNHKPSSFMCVHDSLPRSLHYLDP